MHVLLAINDRRLTETIPDFLAKRPISIDITQTDNCDGLHRPTGQKNAFDLLLIDGSLSAQSNNFVPDFLKNLRKANDRTPAIVIVKHKNDGEEIKFLESGADLVMHWPFSRELLWARMGVLTRRAKGFTQSLTRIGPMEFDHAAQSITINGTDVHLTRRQTAMVEYMIMNAGRVLPREKILDYLYGQGSDGIDRMVDSLVKHVRRKFDAVGFNPIATIYGVGYTFLEIDCANSATSRPSPLPGSRKRGLLPAGVE